MRIEDKIEKYLTETYKIGYNEGLIKIELSREDAHKLGNIITTSILYINGDEKKFAKEFLDDLRNSL